MPLQRAPEWIVQLAVHLPPLRIPITTLARPEDIIAAIVPNASTEFLLLVRSLFASGSLQCYQVNAVGVSAFLQLLTQRLHGLGGFGLLREYQISQCII